VNYFIFLPLVSAHGCVGKDLGRYHTNPSGSRVFYAPAHWRGWAVQRLCQRTPRPASAFSVSGQWRFASPSDPAGIKALRLGEVFMGTKFFLFFKKEASHLAAKKIKPMAAFFYWAPSTSGSFFSFLIRCRGFKGSPRATCHRVSRGRENS